MLCLDLYDELYAATGIYWQSFNKTQAPARQRPASTRWYRGIDLVLVTIVISTVSCLCLVLHRSTTLSKYVPADTYQVFIRNTIPFPTFVWLIKSMYDDVCAIPWYHTYICVCMCVYHKQLIRTSLRVNTVIINFFLSLSLHYFYVH